MKAKNSEKIIRGYLEFAGGLLISTALSMALLTGFIHTNGSEYKLMESKTQEYDKIYARQIALVDKVDSLYNYLVLMGSNDRLNQVVLQKVISTCKMELIEELQIMDSKDVLLYKKLASQINVFLDTKEAIRKAVIEESLVRKDLMRCIQDNKQATRKLTLGNISVETLASVNALSDLYMCLPCLLLSQEPVDLFFSSMQGHATSSPIK